MEIVLNKIEELVADDFMQDIEWKAAFSPQKLTKKEKEMAKRLLRIYLISHSWNKKHSCYHVHGDWRKL